MINCFIVNTIIDVLEVNMVMKSFVYVSGPRMGTNNRMAGIVAPGEKPVKKTSIKKKSTSKKKGKK